MRKVLPKKFLSLATALALLVVSSSSALAATFTLSPAGGSSVCDTFTVDLNLAELSGKQVSGVDAYINFEPSKLDALSVSHTGGIFTSYPLETINASSGKIAIGASASAFSPVTKEGKIVTVTFKAKQTSGTTNLSFDFTAGSTTDSNITEAGTATDILSQPATATYTLAQSGCKTTTTPPPATTAPPKGGGAPQGGFLEPTVFVSFLSLTLIGLGILLKIKSRTTISFEERVLRNL